MARGTTIFEAMGVTSPLIDHAQTKHEGVELWAIRVPPGFDASRLDQMSIGAAGASGDGFHLRDAPSIESAAVITAFPSAKKNRWLVGKRFTRQLVVSVPPPAEDGNSAVVPPPLPPVPPVSGLRLSRPFPDVAPGANSGRKSSKKAKHKR